MLFEPFFDETRKQTTDYEYLSDDNDYYYESDNDDEILEPMPSLDLSDEYLDFLVNVRNNNMIRYNKKYTNSKIVLFNPKFWLRSKETEEQKIRDKEVEEQTKVDYQPVISLEPIKHSYNITNHETTDNIKPIKTKAINVPCGEGNTKIMYIEDNSIENIKTRKPVQKRLNVLCNMNDKCKKSDCCYAHSLEEMVIDPCRFGICRYVSYKNKKYLNVDGCRPCNTLHKNETKQNYIERTSKTKVDVASKTNEEKAKFEQPKIKPIENKIPCNFGNKCNKIKTCPYNHTIVVVNHKHDNKPVQKRLNMMCNMGEKCKRDNCGYAHSLNEMIIESCRFGVCRYVSYKNKKYLNVDGCRPCNTLHKNETKQNYIERTKKY